MTRSIEHAGNRSKPRIRASGTEEGPILETSRVDCPHRASDGDERGGDRLLQAQIPGAAGQPHVTIAKAGHFVQEDAGPELAEVIAAFVTRAR